MFKKLISLMLVMSLTIILTVISMAQTIDNPNPYVKKYIEDNNLSIKENSATNEAIKLNTTLNDDDKFVILTLNNYYNDDLKVANIIKQYYPKSNLYDKTLSTEKEDKVHIMYTIEKIYYSVNDEQKEILKEYLIKYAQCSQDKKAISFLNKIKQIKKRIPNKIEENMLIYNNRSGVMNENKCLTQNDSKITQNVKVGENVCIELEENPSTGASWTYSINDENLIKLIKDERIHTSNLLGAPVTRRFTFQMQREGKAYIHFKYAPAWEKNTLWNECKFNFLIQI